MYVRENVGLMGVWYIRCGLNGGFVRLIVFGLGLLGLFCGMEVWGQGTAGDGLAGTTVLIVRHAEKPASGDGLTAMGEARAKAYVGYFEPFREEGMNVRVDCLFAGADSENSKRPRLTLEPLAQATGMRIDSSVGTKDPGALVALMRQQHGCRRPLVAWRHGQIPALLQAFGAPVSLVPGGKWPDETYDWVLVLGFDAEGRLASQKLIKEHLAVGQN